MTVYLLPAPRQPLLLAAGITIVPERPTYSATELPRLKQTTQEAILEALRYLAERCDGAEAQDGQGFNKPDSHRGKQLACQEYLSEEDTAQALAMLRKYGPGQLAAAGIKLPEEDKAVAEARDLEQARGEITFERATDLLIVTFPYNSRHVAVIKAVKGARFSSNGTKHWTVPLSSGKALLEAFPKFKIEAPTRQTVFDWKPPAIQYAGKITLDGEHLVISFDYNPALVAAVKAIKGARFDGTKKLWRVGVDQHVDALALPNFEIDKAVTERIEADKLAAAKQAEKDRAVAEHLLKFVDGPLPSGRELFQHQKDGVRFLLEKRRAILADDMGLGKSLTSLVAAKAYNLPVIVICPASLLINWKREAAHVGLELTVYSWAKIPKAVDHDFVLIADEAHYAQSIKAQRTKNLLALAASGHCMGAYLLTGTPIKNGRPVNLFPLLAATKHKLADDKRMYEYRYCNAHATRWSKWDTSGAAHLDELHTLTRDVMLRRMKKDCLDLPEKLRVIRSVELSDKADKEYEKAYEALREDYRQRIREGKVSSEAEALVTLNHLRHAGSVAKIETALELAREVIEEGGQVVVFVAFKDAGSEIAVELGTTLFSGDTPTEDRQKMVDRFQAGADKAIVCMLGAGGVGITLTAAQTVILVDRPWTPGDAEQAEDRLHRIGQQNAVTAIWLQYGETDAAIDAILQSKQERIDLVLQGKRKTMRGTGSAGQIAQDLLPGLLG